MDTWAGSVVDMSLGVARATFKGLDSTDVPSTFAANVSFAAGDLPNGLPSNTLVSLPSDGIVLWADLPMPNETPATPNAVFPDRQLPLSLSDADVQTSWETQPSPNVPQYTILGIVNGQYLEVRVFFGTLNPTRSDLQMAQQELSSLSVPPG
jgi:hypothetical protein